MSEWRESEWVQQWMGLQQAEDSEGVTHLPLQRLHQRFQRSEGGLEMAEMVEMHLCEDYESQESVVGHGWDRCVG